MSFLRRQAHDSWWVSRQSSPVRFEGRESGQPLAGAEVPTWSRRATKCSASSRRSETSSLSKMLCRWFPPPAYFRLLFACTIFLQESGYGCQGYLLDEDLFVVTGYAMARDPASFTWLQARWPGIRRAS